MGEEEKTSENNLFDNTYAGIALPTKHPTKVKKEREGVQCQKPPFLQELTVRSCKGTFSRPALVFCAARCEKRVLCLVFVVFFFVDVVVAVRYLFFSFPPAYFP